MKSRYKLGSAYLRGLLPALIVCIFSFKTIAQVSVEMTPGITTDIQGGVQVEDNGDWINQGLLMPGLSTLIFNGDVNQTLRQDGGAFHNMTINKSNGDVLLSGNIQMQQGTLQIIVGDIYLDGHIITLDPLATLSETAGNLVQGSSGYVTTTRSLNAPAGNNIAGMGFAVSNFGNFGMTEIRRGHAAQSANTAQGIHRYFDFIPTHQLATESTVTFFYDDSELNGNTEAELQMFGSPDFGVNWKKIDAVLDIVNNSLTANGITMYSRFTLSSHCLETCIATNASAHDIDIYLNASGLAYLPPEVINLGSTGACGIDSMKVAPNVFDCDDLGIQQVELTIYDHNGCSKSTTANVHVFDSIPPVAYCKNITIEMNGSCEMTIQPSDIDDGSSDACGLLLSLDESTFDCNDIGVNTVHLMATDASGNSGSCAAIVTVNQLLEVMCKNTTINLGNSTSLLLNPFDLLDGDPANYPGFTFLLNPSTLYCDNLGENVITVTATAPNGSVTVCQSTVYVEGPDADCDGVSNPCDVCNGGDDQQDMDNDGIPDCDDWSNWQNLPPDWQCAANKVFVCHSGNVICINQSAVQAHLDHGDILGPCNAASCPQSYAVSPDLSSHIIAEEDFELAAINDADLGLQAFNFPNPFYPETEIRFYLPAEGLVSLMVYNSIGEPVRRLLDNPMLSGWNESIFDGRNLPPGMYVFRLEANGQSITRPMMLMRK